MTVSLSNAASSPAELEGTPLDYLAMYLRQVEASVQSGDKTLAEQQIQAVEQRVRTGAASAALAGPALSTVHQYVSQIAAQIRAGDLASAEQALFSTRQYASKVINAAR